MIRDQAENLRRVIENIKINQITSNTDVVNTAKKKPAKVYTITSGKGGVGKTNITINLALALSDLGYKVTILDADFGLANIEVLFGIVPKYTLLDIIDNNKSIFEVLTEGPKNIKFISGGSGVEKLVKLEKKQLDLFIKNIALLDKISDIILIDTGAGLSDSVMSFVLAADEVLLVTTPDPTSITDAYALIKMVAEKDRNKNIKVIVNKAENIKEANNILDKLTIVSDRFLSLKLCPFGYVLYDEMVVKAVKLQQPFSLAFPKAQASRQIRNISKELIEINDLVNSYSNTGFKGFINRLINLL